MEASGLVGYDSQMHAQINRLECFRLSISCFDMRGPFPVLTGLLVLRMHSMNFFRRISRNKSVSMDSSPQVIWLGDSLINRLQYAPIWEEKFAPSFRCLNLGIDGLTVEGLLRRIVEGDFPVDGFDAKAIVLLIGTNNVTDSAEYIAKKTEEIITAIHNRQPFATIFLIELFPKGPGPSKYREKNLEVNKELRERLKGTPDISVVNLDPGFVRADGTISRDDLPDLLHFSDAAYDKAFSPLYSLLDQKIKQASVK